MSDSPGVCVCVCVCVCPGVGTPILGLGREVPWN